MDGEELISKAIILEQKLDIKDRRYRLKNYKNCFVGNAAIPIIINLKFANNKDEAIKFGNKLIEANIIKHVQNEHKFKNEKLFYKFVNGYNRRKQPKIVVNEPMNLWKASKRISENIEMDKITSTTIDDILNEIDENEEKIQILKQEKKSKHGTDINWNEILRELSSGNIGFIKNLISSNEIDINNKNPKNGMTLLMYSVLIGNIDLVKAICNFGADVHIKDNDGDNALYYAIKCGRYKITELLYYRQLSGKLGNDLKHIAMQIHTKNKQAAFMKANQFKIADFMDFMIKAIEQRAPFGEDMLFYAWYFVLNDEGVTDGFNYTKKIHPLQSKLFKVMMKTYENIISDTSDELGWKWLKEQFIDSLIWYLPHPLFNKNHDDDDDDDDADDGGDIDKILKQTLFYELYIRIRAESKKQSDLLLKEKINRIKMEKVKGWNELISYTVNTKYSKIARQDLCGCLIPKYTENDLCEKLYPPSTHFSAKKHYDKQIYLNQLLFRGNIMDNIFQRDMKLITKEINLETGDKVKYTAGPIKTLSRSQTKVENDYINQDYPTSAKILDINRCALHFKTIESMMKFIKIFTSKIKSKKANYCIVDIIRCKNGWSVYNEQYPQYTDIKLNVMVESVINPKHKIITEIQFLLDLMSEFKHKAHKLYSVERKSELSYNFGMMAIEMQTFRDSLNINDILINIIDNDDIKCFKLLWNISNQDVNILIDADKLEYHCHDTALLHIITNNNGKINNYLQTECVDTYFKAILNYIKKYVAKYSYGTMFNYITSSKIIKGHENQDNILKTFFYQMLSLIDNPKKVRKLFFCDTNDDSLPFLNVLCYRAQNYKKSVQFILNTKLITDNLKCNLLFQYDSFNRAFLSPINDNMLQIIQYIQNDRNLLLKALKCKFDSYDINILIAICRCKDPQSTYSLKLLLNNPLITEHEKMKFLLSTESEYGNSSIHYAFTNIYNGNALQIINYYIGHNKKEILMKLLLKKNKSGNTALVITERSDKNIILRVLHYFKNSKSNLLQLLSSKNKNGRTVFGMICGTKRDTPEILQYILNCDVLTDTDILRLFYDKDNEDNIALMYCTDMNGFIILNYFKENKKLILQLLTSQNKTGKTALMFLENEPKMKILKFVLNSNILSDDDKFNLLSHQDITGKSVLYWSSKNAPNKHFDDMYFNELLDKVIVLRIIDYMKGDEIRLKKMLLQQTNDGDTFLMCCVHLERVINPILNSLSTINDNKIVSDLLKCKNKQNQTVYDIAAQNNYKEQVRLIAKWMDYLRFDEELSHVNDKKIDFSFLERKKEAKPSFTAKCICGCPLKLASASSINWKTRSAVHCIQCGKTRNGNDQIYHCNNNRKHNNGSYIICTECVKRDLMEKYKEFEKQNALKNMQQYKTNPFITSCYFNKYDTICKILKHIGDNKEMLMKLLISKDDQQYNGIFHIIKSRDIILSAKLLQLLIINNNIITNDDKFKIITEKNQFKVTPLARSNNECGMMLVNYFKNDKNKILQMVLPREKYDFPALFGVTDTVRFEILNYLKNDKKSIIKLLFKLESRDEKKLLGTICVSKKNEMKTLKFIINCNVLNDKYKLKLFNNSYDDWSYGTLTPFDNACNKDSYKEKQMALEILKYIGNDRFILIKFLSPSMHGRYTPLIQLCQNNDKYSIMAVKYILNNPVLSKMDKLKLLLATESKREYAPTPIKYAFDNKNINFALEILNYFKNDEKSMIQILSQSCLIFWSLVEDEKILKILLKIINNLNDYQLKWKLLSDVNEEQQTFLWRVRNIGIVFTAITDDEIIEKLLNHKDKKYETCIDYIKDSYSLNEINNIKNVRRIKDYYDYLKLNKLLLSMTNNIDINEYDTNPFITSCYLGRYNTIKQLLNCVNNKTSLLLNNYDENGNNCLLVLAENKHFQIILFILNDFLNKKDIDLKLDLLSDKNEFSGQHILLYLCSNGYFDVSCKILDHINDNKIILELLYEKDNNNKSCFDYADI